MAKPPQQIRLDVLDVLIRDQLCQRLYDVARCRMVGKILTVSHRHAAPQRIHYAFYQLVSDLRYQASLHTRVRVLLQKRARLLRCELASVVANLFERYLRQEAQRVLIELGVVENIA